MTDAGLGVDDQEAAVAKRCCMCGIDVSSAKRERDSAGRYWCVSCSALEVRDTRKASPGPLCADCGTLVAQPIEFEHERLCPSCVQIRQAEIEHAAQRRAEVTFDPEKRLRRDTLGLLIAAALFIALMIVRYTALGLQFESRLDDWLNAIAIPLMLVGALALLIAMGVRKRIRLASYDSRLSSVENGIVAMSEGNQAQSVVERTEPIRRVVHRALRRIEAAAGQGVEKASRLVQTFEYRRETRPFVTVLSELRPGTTDLVARNREIETLAYLGHDWDTAINAVTAVLLRVPNDFDALSRQAMIHCALGDFDRAKKIFTRIINLAKQRRDELAIADGIANLGVVHQLLEEIDDAHKYHNTALFMYKKLTGHEDREADCYGNIGFIHSRKKEDEQAEFVFRKALEINDRLDRTEGIALDNGVLGLMVYNKPGGNLSEAERMLRRSIKLNDQLGRFGAVAASYGNLGLVHAKKRNYKSARKMLTQARTIYQRLNRQQMVSRVDGMLQQLSKSSGLLPKAETS